MAIFATFLRPVFPASRVQHISDLRSKFALRPHHVWETSTLRPLRLGEEKKKEEEREKKKPQGKNIMSASATQGGHNKWQKLASLQPNVRAKES